MKKIILSACLVTLLAGCSTQTFQVNGAPTNAMPDSQKMQPFFVNGIGQKKGMNAAEVCGGADKVAFVETQQTALDVLLSSVTFGIYTPRHAKVYCTK